MSNVCSPSPSPRLFPSTSSAVNHVQFKLYPQFSHRPTHLGMFGVNWPPSHVALLSLFFKNSSYFSRFNLAYCDLHVHVFVGKIPYSFRPVHRLVSITLCERPVWTLRFCDAWLLGIVMIVQILRFTAQFCENIEWFTWKTIQY